MASILIVDDEPTMLEMLAMALKEHEVVRARDGAQALVELARCPFDVVIADEEMPNMRGTELFEHCARRHPTAVRILLTGHATARVAIGAINRGQIFRFLEKPCPPAQLQDVVREALREAKHTAASATLIRVAAEVTDSLRDQPKGIMALGAAASKLSRREREIFEMLTRGLRVSVIAQRLGLSQHTIRNHLKAMYRKFGVHSQAELVQLAT